MDKQKYLELLKAALTAETKEEKQKIKDDLLFDMLASDAVNPKVAPQADNPLIANVKVDEEALKSWFHLNPGKTTEDYINEKVPKPILPENTPKPEEPTPYVTVDGAPVTEPPRSVRKYIKYAVVSTIGITAIIYILINVF